MFTFPLENVKMYVSLCHNSLLYSNVQRNNIFLERTVFFFSQRKSLTKIARLDIGCTWYVYNHIQQESALPFCDNQLWGAENFWDSWWTGGGIHWGFP
jgi:hypothetical protein